MARPAPRSRIAELAAGLALLLVTAAACQTGAVRFDGAADTGSATPSTLIGTSWRVTEIDGEPVLEDPQTTIAFESPVRSVGSTGCNRYAAPLQMSATALRFGRSGATRQLCAPALMEQERRFLAALAGTRVFRSDGDVLWLLDVNDRVRMRLTRPGERSRIAHAFDCFDGPSVVVTRADGGVVLAGPGGIRRLAPQRATSGGRYSDGDATVWSKGREVALGLDGRTYLCTENLADTIRADARARGVEFLGVGDALGWIVEVLRDRIVFIGHDGTERAAVSRPPTGVAIRGGIVYAAETEAHRLRVLILDRECFDATARRWTATVDVELDGREYRGCGSALPGRVSRPGPLLE